mgnify:CR=1 FL=1
MMIEVLVRWPDLEVRNDAESKLDQIINGEEPKVSLTYTYSPMVFSIKDLRAFNKVNLEHTAIRFYNGDVYTIKVPYPDFKEIYVDATGNSISYYQPISDGEPTPKRRKKKDDEGDIPKL